MLILVRHGRTAANKAGQLQGRLDQDLDEVGAQQAVAVAAMVRGIGPVDAVISSPLKRAQQTAAVFGLPVEIDERFIELSYGEYEGVKHADVPSEVWNNWREDFAYVPKGGESLATLDERVRAACNDLIERASTSNV
ncbi:MAG: alpha-ribazole phosphatase, partial [Ilumatobacter sp.]